MWTGVPPLNGLLPILLDFGTNNRELLNDPLYLGLRQTRPSIQETEPFVDGFVQAVQESFPNCCIHFEDWKEQTPSIIWLATVIKYGRLQR